MKIAITGHSKGIGKAIADVYHGNDVKGFSRQNGYDITDSSTINRIIVESQDCDVFVNNAYAGTAQVDIFERLLSIWKQDESKTIVNINSRTIYNAASQRQYTINKKLLRSSAVNAIRDPNRRCRIININPGYIKTDMTEEVHHQFKMMSVEQLADMIKWCLDQPSGIEIGELSVWCTTLD